MGANPDRLRITGQTIARAGSSPTWTCSQFANVCVLGHEIEEKLFPLGDPVGGSVRIGGKHFYAVVGVTSYKAPSAGTGSSLAVQDFNKDVYIPITTDRAGSATIISEKQGGSRPRRSS